MMLSKRICILGFLYLILENLRGETRCLLCLTGGRYTPLLKKIKINSKELYISRCTSSDELLSSFIFLAKNEVQTCSVLFLFKTLKQIQWNVKVRPTQITVHHVMNLLPPPPWQTFRASSLLQFLVDLHRREEPVISIEYDLSFYI